MSTQKHWGLFAADGTPVATGDSHHDYKCPQQQYETPQYVHSITGETFNGEPQAVPCPWVSTGVKSDRCTRCGMKFIYP